MIGSVARSAALVKSRRAGDVDGRPGRIPVPRTYKICSPFAPGTETVRARPQTSPEQLAVSERLDNIRVMPLAELTRRGAVPAHG